MRYVFNGFMSSLGLTEIESTIKACYEFKDTQTKLKNYLNLFELCLLCF